MQYTPKPHQEVMTQWLLDHPEGASFSGCGLGKTVTTLNAIAELILQGASKGALVIAPLRVTLISWPSEVRKWDHLKWLRMVNLRTPEGIKAWEEGSADIYLINSEQLPSIERPVKGAFKKSLGFVDKHIRKRKQMPVDILVVDELSLAKSHGSKRFNALRPYLHDIEGKFRTPFKRKWGLTGTPAPNSYLDLFAQVRLLDGGKRLGRAFTQFRQTYFESDYMGFKWTIREGAKEKIDAKLSDFALVMRSEDYLDVPECTVEEVEVTLPAEAAKAYKTLEKELLVQLKTGEIEALSAAALTTKLLQITAGCVFDSEKGIHVLHDAKLDALRKIHKAHAKEPLLVLTSYTHERERVLAAFPEARQFHEKDMPEWKAGKIPMWVANAKSLSFGIDGLQDAGRIAVWMTPTYSWETDFQTNARLIRQGQERQTIIYRILASNTIDWAVVEAVKDKEAGNNGLMAAVKNLQLLKENS